VKSRPRPMLSRSGASDMRTSFNRRPQSGVPRCRVGGWAGSGGADTRSGVCPPDRTTRPTTSCGAGSRLQHRSYGAVNDRRKVLGAPRPAGPRSGASRLVPGTVAAHRPTARPGARCGIAGSGPKAPRRPHPGQLTIRVPHRSRHERHVRHRRLWVDRGTTL
jgi:hypothetical protein